MMEKLAIRGREDFGCSAAQCCRGNSAARRFGGNGYKVDGSAALLRAGRGQERMELRIVDRG